jgi:mono/diheme cytochrome c family protein
VRSGRFFLAVAIAFGLLGEAAGGANANSDKLAGAALYRDKGCARCHGAHGEGTLKAPALVNIRKNKMWTPAKISHQIMNGGQNMPPFSDALSDAEVAQIVLFLRSNHWPSPQIGPPN